MPHYKPSVLVGCRISFLTLSFDRMIVIFESLLEIFNEIPSQIVERMILSFGLQSFPFKFPLTSIVGLELQLEIMMSFNYT